MTARSSRPAVWLHAVRRGRELLELEQEIRQHKAEALAQLHAELQGMQPEEDLLDYLRRAFK